VSYENKPDSGAVFKNEKQDEKDRDYAGDALIGGVHYWVSCYINTSKAGKKYLSLRFKPKDGGPQRKSTYSKDDTTARQTAAQEMDDEIPF